MSDDDKRSRDAERDEDAWVRFAAGAAVDPDVDVPIAVQFADDMLGMLRQRRASGLFRREGTPAPPDDGLRERVEAGVDVLGFARKAVQLIIADLTDRRGLRHEWDRIDRDVREEIETTWQAAIVDQIIAALAAPAGEGGQP